MLGWRRDKAQQRPTGSVVSVIPDWICEVLSPGNLTNDTIKKKRIYHQAQVGHYWLVDPIRETLQVYRWDQPGYVEILSAERTDKVRAEPFEAIELDPKDAQPSPGMAPHSPLTLNLRDKDPEGPTKKAERRVIEFFSQRLLA